ncbi:VOC family protein [Clostridium estertheticum]|uniref:VOC family protein n=1 Tax=Clostridium estertheticum TaxID=238834 RepID=UPI0013E923A3|nr:VOC family protein [Clostridium estertheticum]MBZ9686766.1 VOC family protein [Clostridium estertheticum]
MQKIVPHLWYDKEAKEAATFYISLFENSKILNEAVIGDTPSGNTEIISFELSGQQFTAISAGPYFKFNPSISLMVACNSFEEVNTKWKALSEGGTELMPLGEYPFSKWYGWIQDRYGLSWQLMLVDSGQVAQKITPNFLFSNSACGKTEEAVKYYAEVFENSEIGIISRYGKDEAKSSKAQVNYAAFKLCGIDFSAMDNAFDVDFNFNEAFSLIVNCEDQKEIDYYWDKLSAVPGAEQCGWVKDQFGVSWQIVPSNMDEVLLNGTKDEIKRVTEAFLKMKKFDLNALDKARLGR